MKIKVRIFLGIGLLLLIFSAIIIYTIILLQTSHTLVTKMIDHETAMISGQGILSFKLLQSRFLTGTILLVIFLFISILAAVLLAFVFSGSLVNPVNTLVNTIKEAEKNNYESKVPVKTGDEFGDLALSFNSIIQKIKKNRSQPEHHDRNKKETEIALRIQTSTCPPIPAHDELEIAASMYPATEVGGDYYDLVLDKKNNLWIGIGDVSGNGITPGLIVMMASTAFNTYVLEKGSHTTPGDAIISINRILTDNIRIRLNQNYFMSMNFIKYTGSGQFLQSGSHMDIIVYRKKTKRCDLFPTDGVYMGIIPDISGHTEDKAFHMDTGDIMVVYTNGIIEAKNKDDIEQLLGIDALIKTIINNGEKDASTIMAAIREQSLVWCGFKPVDDMTVVVVKRIR
ncbi:MAG: SpoIIE family protein phosphatase [Spirochaetales bacterium]|nr:SpoIIE family protein phosphatase [Spirochaetales bacterium]